MEQQKEMNPWTDRKAERQKDRERADRLEDGRWWLFRWTGRDPGGSETDGQIHRQGAWREVRGRRAECPMRQEAGHEVALQVAQEKWDVAKNGGDRVEGEQDRVARRRPSELVLVPTEVMGAS